MTKFKIPVFRRKNMKRKPSVNFSTSFPLPYFLYLVLDLLLVSQHLLFHVAWLVESCVLWLQVYYALLRDQQSDILGSEPQPSRPQGSHLHSTILDLWNMHPPGDKPLPRCSCKSGWKCLHQNLRKADKVAESLLSSPGRGAAAGI